MTELTVKPRVLCLSSTYPRWSGDTEPAFVATLVELLSEHYQIDVIAPLFHGSEPLEDNGPILVHRYRYPGYKAAPLAYEGGIMAKLKRSPLKFFLLPTFLLAQTWAIHKRLRQGEYQVVHAHWWLPQGICYRLATIGLRSAPPLIVTLHGTDLYSWRRGVKRKVMNAVLKSAQVITTVSNAMLECLDSEVRDSTLASVAPMGIDLNIFKRTKPWSSRKNLIFVGRITQEKGLDVLIHALSLISNETDACLTVVGDGPFKADCMALASRLGVANRISFVGSKIAADVALLLNEHAIALVPSRISSTGQQEGLGLVVAEAAACGCAIIASNYPAVHDMVTEDHSALLVEANEAAPLANAIMQLLNDPILAEQIAGNAAKEISEGFSWPICANRYRLLYEAASRPSLRK